MNGQEKKRRELKKAYHPEMGVYIVRNLKDGRCFVEAAANLNGGLNGARFKLETGTHPCRTLQEAWNAQGPDSFRFEILDRLEPDEDALKTDYREDLAELKALWMEKLSGEEKAVFYGNETGGGQKI